LAIGAGTFTLGILTYGFLLDALGLAPTLLLFAVANTALPLTLLAMPARRDMKRPQRSVESPPKDAMAEFGLARLCMVPSCPIPSPVHLCLPVATTVVRSRGKVTSWF